MPYFLKYVTLDVKVSMLVTFVLFITLIKIQLESTISTFIPTLIIQISLHIDLHK